MIGLSFTLEDRFGDNGLVAMVIMKPIDNETLFVDTWFMSCRVLKRGMENFTLNIMVGKAKNAGYKTIIGEYLPTLKNKMVRNHYADLGFSRTNRSATAQYGLDIESYQMKESYINKKV